MNNVGNDSAHSELLTEQQLKLISRHSGEIAQPSERVYRSEDDLNKLESVFTQVFQAAEDRDISASHRVAAWNTLCALIDQCISSQNHVSNDFIWSNGVWDRAFALYIDNGHNARPKSSKQLLATLSAGLRGKHPRPDLERHVAERLVHGILHDENPVCLKACLQALAQFLRKEILPLRNVLSCLDELRSAIRDNHRTLAEELLYALLRRIGIGDVGSVVGQVVSAVLDKAAQQDIHNSIFDERTDGARSPIWLRPLDLAIRSNAVPAEQLRIHIFPILFKRDVSEYIHFLNRHGLQCLERTSEAKNSAQDDTQDLSDEVFYAALQAGKENGILYECEHSTVSRTSSAVLIPVRFIGSLLYLVSRRARLTGLSLLITSHSATRPFPKSNLTLLKRHLHNFYADTDPNFRSEVFSLMQRLMDRFRAITAVLARTCAMHSDKNSDPAASAALVYHRSFLEWTLDFLGWELRPTASYQRHISALKTLLIVARSGLDDTVPREYTSKSAIAETHWPFHLSIMTPGLRRLLLDLLIDPFEDVRQISASILNIFNGPHNQNRDETCKELSMAIDRAEKLMLVSGRSDQADGLARLHTLIHRRNFRSSAVSEQCCSSHAEITTNLVEYLERMLNIAACNLPRAVEKYPMHGLMTSLRYLIAENSSASGFESLLPRLITCLHQTWDVVKPVLCDDAPEGYLPEEAVDIPEVSTKDTLSYSWRGLKESSLLLETIILKTSLSSEALISLGNLCFTQLAELRHRGAFSTVAQTWIACCMKCSGSASPDESSQVRLWYDQILRILCSNTTINTRRSAGLPALICGLLIADKSGELVSLAFSDLSNIARQSIDSAASVQSSLPQVHALNCIKDVLKSTRLGEQSERYVPQSLRLAALSLRSSSWAIRNCGLMLFRAVIDRLLGTSDTYLDDVTQNSRRFTFPQHQQLLETILDLLVLPEQASNSVLSNTYEGVFPALQLLQRMYVSQNRLPLAKERVLALTANTSWHVRDKAARTYAALVIRDDIDPEIERILENIAYKDQNALHGALLVVRYLVRERRAAEITSTGSGAEKTCKNGALPIIHNLSALCSANHMYRNYECPVVKAAYIDILNELSAWRHSFEGLAEQFQMSDLLQQAQLNVIEELEHSLDVGCSDSGHAVLRTVLSSAFGVQIHTRAAEVSREAALSLITSLGRIDADACCSFFRSSFEHRPHHTSGATSADDILFRACSSVLSGNFPIHLKCEVQRLLLDLDERHPNLGSTPEHSKLFIEACSATSSPLRRHTNQQYADQWLQLQAVVLESRSHNEQDKVARMDLNLSTWIKHCCVAIQGQSIFSSDAAAIAVSRPKSLWKHLGRTNSELLCQLCFGIYDLLNDDDELIRLLASRAASQIASIDPESGFDRSLESIASSQKLVNVMLRKWVEDDLFIREAFKRAFGIDETEHTNIADRLGDFEILDNALFAEEKQNLFLDDAREARVWSQAILNVKATSIPKPLISCLARWVVDGLDSLTHKAQSEIDGALGWSTKPEIFTLGLQVTYGAELLLSLVERGVRLSIRPSALLLKLGNFSTVAASQRINALWRKEINRLMTWAVACRLRRCRYLLDTVVREHEEQ